MIVEDARGDEFREIFYGQMHRVLQCALPDKPFLEDLQRENSYISCYHSLQNTRLDASKELTTYKDTTTTIVTDIRVVSSVVGRVLSRNKWGIVDRSGEYARTDFIARDDQQIVAEIED